MFDRIYWVVSEFIRVSKEKTGKTYFYLRREGAENSKNWKYFEVLYQRQKDGEIDIPAYFEAQFDSPAWGGRQIYPNQLNSERARKVWEKYQRNRVKLCNITLTKEQIAQKLLAAIYTEIDFGFISDRLEQFNVKDYLIRKQVMHDFVFCAVSILPVSIIKKEFATFWKDIKQKTLSQVEDVISMSMTKEAKGLYRSEIMGKSRLFKKVIEEIIKEKENFQK